MAENRPLMGVRPSLIILLIFTAVIRALVIGLKPVPPDSILYKAFAELHWPVFLTVAVVLHKRKRPIREGTATGILFGLMTAFVRQFFVDDGFSGSGPLAEWASPDRENTVLRAEIAVKSLATGLIFGFISGVSAATVRWLRKGRPPGKFRKTPSPATAAGGGKLAPVAVLLGQASLWGLLC